MISWTRVAMMKMENNVYFEDTAFGNRTNRVCPQIRCGHERKRAIMNNFNVLGVSIWEGGLDFMNQQIGRMGRAGESGIIRSLVVKLLM